MNAFVGVLCAFIGSIIWYKQDILKHTYILNSPIIFSILLIIVGGIIILSNATNIISIFTGSKWITNIDKLNYIEIFTVFLLIYLGTGMYILASYFHLTIKNWTFIKALILAIPLVLIEYQFSLRGNYLANTILKMNTIQITLVTMMFYLINAWLLNFFFLKQPVIWWREVSAFILICCAFLIIFYDRVK